MDKGYRRFFERNPMPEDEARKLFASMQLRTIDKGEYIVKQGDYNSDFYIIDKGIFSGFQKNQLGAEVTLWFAFSGEPIINVWCHAMNRFSPINIISETKSTVWVIDKHTLDRLILENPDISLCMHKILLGQLAYYENRLLEMSKPSNATERYKWIMEWHPELLREVTISRIASFLGITVQSLSRIRHDMFLKKRAVSACFRRRS